MVIEVPVKGYFNENCYFFLDEDSKRGFVVDPGAEGERLLRLIRANGWEIEKILLTHGHFDHFGGVDALRKALGVPVLAHRRSDEYLLEPLRNLSSLCVGSLTIEGAEYLEDGDVVALDGNPDFCLDVIYAPGHTTDSVVFYSESRSLAFVGDAIFKGSLGSSEYPGGNPFDLRRSVVEKIFSLPDETTLFSGHTERTTVGTEKGRYRRRAAP